MQLGGRYEGFAIQVTGQRSLNRGSNQYGMVDFEQESESDWEKRVKEAESAEWSENVTEYEKLQSKLAKEYREENPINP